MNTTLLLQLSLAFASIYCKQDSQKVANKYQELKIENNPVFKKAPLFYYHQFMKVHNQVNKNVPLKQHYVNERSFRKERDNLQGQQNKVEREKLFAYKDNEHEIQTIKNKIVKAKFALNNTNKIFSQKETAVKFEINHDEMWKVYYTKRYLFHLFKAFID